MKTSIALIDTQEGDISEFVCSPLQFNRWVVGRQMNST